LSKYITCNRIVKTDVGNWLSMASNVIEDSCDCKFQAFANPLI